MSPVKTVEAIEMPFASKTQVGSGNHLLDIAALFQPNTVLWAFRTIQTSSLRCREFLVVMAHCLEVVLSIELGRSSDVCERRRGLVLRYRECVSVVGQLVGANGVSIFAM